ncbi:heptaprenyl diphosphate synthase component 1 [Paenibacillus sp. SGZ-1009]|uniref:heptaprenyl diphosphate synthase component 1 n=1 Tax=Paenibacillus campi TaxID=3106031 RepID=UPI002AFF4E29|nr:heptaprenyl diphosphate synthase component 1 [Paenibacillus sp. SGZ-1009]
MKPYRLLETSQKYTEYDMIQKHTEVASFPDVRARLLFLFLSKAAHNRLQANREQLFPLVTGIVQMALDTHDRIDTSSAYQREQQMRSRQLNVLAGDYFSSRFYELLARAGEIEMVARLSEAICENNRLKMDLYEHANRCSLTTEQYMEANIQLKMQLFLSFTPYIEMTARQLWEDILYLFSRCELLAAELKSGSNVQPFGEYGLYYVLEQLTLAERSELEKSLTAETSARYRQEWEQRYQISARVEQLLQQTLAAITERMQQEQHTELKTAILELTDSYAALVHQV